MCIRDSSRSAHNEINPNSTTVTVRLNNRLTTNNTQIVSHVITRLLNVRTMAGSRTDSGWRLRICPANNSSASTTNIAKINSVVQKSNNWSLFGVAGTTF